MNLTFYKRNSHARSYRRKETMGREPHSLDVLLYYFSPLPPRPSLFPSPLLSLCFSFSLCDTLTWVMFSSIVFSAIAQLTYWHSSRSGALSFRIDRIDLTWDHRWLCPHWNIHSSYSLPAVFTMLRVGSWLYGKKPAGPVDSLVELKDCEWCHIL